MRNNKGFDYPPLAFAHYDEGKGIDIDLMLDIRNACHNKIVKEQALQGLDYDTTKKILEYEIQGVDEILDLYNYNRNKNGKH